MRRRGVTILFLILALLVLPGAHSAPDGSQSTGGTTAKMDGSVLRLQVRIDIVVSDVDDADNIEAAQFLEDGIAKFWNDAFAELATGCLSFALDVDIALVAPDAVSLVRGERREPLGQGLPAEQWVVDKLGGMRDWVMKLTPVPDGVALATSPGRHVIYVVESGVAPSTTYDPYDGDGHTPGGEDYASPLEHELWGVWEDDLGEDGFAHEFGHLLGLGDDYDDEGEVLPGREGTLMAGAVGGSEVDRNLLDRLADLARGAGEDVPVCATWTGSAPEIRSEVVYSGGPYRCADAWAFQFVFTEAADGTVKGSGSADLAENWVCEPDFPGSESPTHHGTFKVEGERDGDAFNLRFTDPTAAGVGMVAMWNPEFPKAALRIPISDGAGSVDASWDWSFTNPDGSLVTYHAGGAVRIDCPDCR